MSPSSDPGDEGRDFVAAAEARRRGGDPLSAIALAEQGLARLPNSAQGRVALALALLESGQPERARAELEQLLASRGVPTAEAPEAAAISAPPVRSEPTFDGPVADTEIEDAFADAETNPEEMMDANRVVEQTLRGEALDAIEPFDVSEHPTYATQTMASLLEKQGRPAEASALRTSLGDAPTSGGVPVRASDDVAGDLGVGDALDEQERQVATLESWLRNIRRGGSAAGLRRGAS